MSGLVLPTLIVKAWDWLKWFFGSFFSAAFASLSSAMVMSAVVHTVIIFGVGIRATNPALFQDTRPLEVVLVNARTMTAPLAPEVLAQANLDGGGDVQEERQAKSPLPASDRNATASAETLESRIQARVAEARRLMSQAKSNYAINQEHDEAPAQPKPSVPAPASLAETSLEMARLQARISTDWEAYQKYPRRDNAAARAKEYPFARYVEDWRLKVERIGNMNYPEAAKREGIHGNLLLTVSIRANGSLVDVQIDRSSGSRILDAAAIKIVQMSAPFAPFSDEMRKQVDIFEISRTWHFTTSDRLENE